MSVLAAIEVVPSAAVSLPAEANDDRTNENDSEYVCAVVVNELVIVLVIFPVKVMTNHQYTVACNHYDAIC